MHRSRRFLRPLAVALQLFAAAGAAGASVCTDACDQTYRSCAFATCGSLFYCAACEPARQSCVFACTCGGVTCPTPDDQDGDLVPDALEAQLISRFAPYVLLHPGDAYRPSSAEWYMARTQMRYDHSGCSDDGILGVGSVTAATIANQSHQAKSGWPFCSHGGAPYSSGGSSRSDFFLQIPNDASEEQVRQGQSLGPWPCYTHVRRSPGVAGYDLQFWFFYPYNGPSTWGPGAHEGDWEHATVRVSADGSQIASLYTAAHVDEGGWHPAGAFFTAGDGRPIVFSAWHSHASYVGIGMQVRGPNKPDDETSSYGPIWDCAANAVNLGEKERPFGGKTFPLYSGQGGEIGALSGGCDSLGICYSGPYGPTFKPKWNDDDLPD